MMNPSMAGISHTHAQTTLLSIESSNQDRSLQYSLEELKLFWELRLSTVLFQLRTALMVPLIDVVALNTPDAARGATPSSAAALLPLPGAFVVALFLLPLGEFGGCRGWFGVVVIIRLGLSGTT